MTDLTTRRPSIMVVAVALFLLFDLTAFSLNFWMSWKIEKHTVEINLAGRQRMLSQRISKTLLQWAEARSHREPTEVTRAELQHSVVVFGRTLKSFSEGGTTVGDGRNELVLDQVRSAPAKKAVDAAVTLWHDYHAVIAAVLSAEPDSVDAPLSTALRMEHTHEPQLLKLMNDLTTDLEARTQAEAREIRLYQGTAFGLGLLNFVWAVWLNKRRLLRTRREHTLLDDLINKVAACVLAENEMGAVVKANRTAEQMLGYPAGALAGCQAALLLKKESDSDDFIGRRQDGSEFIASVTRARTEVDGEALYIVTVLDVTAQRLTEKRLSGLAYHDLLTKLPNRLLFDERLRQATEQVQMHGGVLAVLFVDLDHFKPVNDVYGHAVGDLLLQAVAQRLRGCLRESDLVSRRGGDEFTVLAVNVGSPEQASKLAHSILDQLTRPFVIDQHTLQIGGSIGVSLCPADSTDAHTLTRHADAAMYRAKEQGRGRVCFYSATPDA